MALGEDSATFIAMWHEGALSGHEESMFYPLVVMWTRGKHDEAIRGFNELAQEIRVSAAGTVDQLTAAGGWLAQWGAQGRELIEGARCSGPARH